MPSQQNHNAAEEYPGHERLVTEIQNRGLEILESIQEEAPDKEKMKKQAIELADIATRFNRSKSPWFIGGGTGLELASGGFRRVHQDVDITVFEKDLDTWKDFFKEEGYKIIGSGMEEISWEEAVARSKGGHSIRILDPKILDSGDTRQLIEILPIKSIGDSYDVQFGDFENIRVSYLNAVEVEVEGVKLLTAPPELIALHKMTDCRLKDLQDVKVARNYFEAHNPEVNAKFDALQRDVFRGYRLSGQNISIYQLLQKNLTLQDAKALLYEKDVVHEESQEFAQQAMEESRPIFEIYEAADSADLFEAAVLAKYGALIKGSEKVVAEYAEFLFADPDERKTREELALFNFNKRMVQRFSGSIKHRLRSVKLAEALY